MTTRPLIAMTAFVTALLFLAGGALAADATPTAKDAEAFVARVETELVSLNEYSARVAWISNNFITDDTMWLQARVRADMRFGRRLTQSGRSPNTGLCSRPQDSPYATTRTTTRRPMGWTSPG